MPKDDDDPRSGKGKGKGRKKGTGGVPWKPLFFVAVGVLVAYVVLLGYLFLFVAEDAKERSWNHHVYLLTGAEAIVFTTVGWLFGREVNRGKAEQADRAARNARNANAARGRAEGRRKEFAELVRSVTQAEQQRMRAAPADSAQAGSALEILREQAERHLSED